MKTPFKVFGYKISHDEKYKRLCIHIPLSYFKRNTEDGVNTKAINAAFLMSTYLYNEGIIAFHENYGIHFKDVFFPSTIFKNHPIN